MAALITAPTQKAGLVLIEIYCFFPGSYLIPHTSYLWQLNNTTRNDYNNDLDIFEIQNGFFSNYIKIVWWETLFNWFYGGSWITGLCQNLSSNCFNYSQLCKNNSLIPTLIYSILVYVQIKKFFILPWIITAYLFLHIL